MSDACRAKHRDLVEDAGLVAANRALFERPSDAGRGRVVVVVFDGDTEIERHTLDGDDPTVRIAVPVTSGVLGIEIEDGGDGPYRDAVIVREAIVVRPGG